MKRKVLIYGTSAEDFFKRIIEVFFSTSGYVDLNLQHKEKKCMSTTFELHLSKSIFLTMEHAKCVTFKIIMIQHQTFFNLTYTS